MILAKARHFLFRDLEIVNEKGEFAKVSYTLVQTVFNIIKEIESI